MYKRQVGGVVHVAALLVRGDVGIDAVRLAEHGRAEVRVVDEDHQLFAIAADVHHHALLAVLLDDVDDLAYAEEHAILPLGIEAHELIVVLPERPGGGGVVGQRRRVVDVEVYLGCLLYTSRCV